MNTPVIAIGLDAMAPELVERWVADGSLPTLAKLFARGTYARQKNFGLYRTENSWLTLLHGCAAGSSHEWGHQDYSSGDYTVTERASYGFNRYPPFYALGDQYRVAIFDVPLTCMVPDVSGVQLLGWGTEVNQILRQSSPPGLMAEMIERHGRHPLYDTISNADDGTETLSYRIPCIYDVEKLRVIKDQLIAASQQRTAIIKDLMHAQHFDLVMCAYAEVHTAGHLFWHLSQPHPLADPLRQQAGSDFILEVLQAIDREIGELLEELPADAQLMIFSPHGMQANTLDLYSMLFLPELLYRWSSGAAALSYSPAGGPVPAPALGYRRHWREEVWDLRTAHGDRVLESPFEQEARKDPLDWDPGNWYCRQWPTLKAFTLPGYSEGLIRINVAGRDGPGGIAPEDFTQVCDNITRLVMEMVDARTGTPIAQEVVRVRTTPGDTGPDMSPADLMVLWKENLTTDVVEHPHHGRIGPAPFFRSGGHATEGFVLACGDGFGAGVRLPAISTEDLTATLLNRMGVAVPGHVEGMPLVFVQPHASAG